MATFLDDPNQVGLLSLGLRLMSTPGKFGAALGTSGLGAMGDMQQAKQAQAAAKQRAAQEKLLKMQMEQMLAQQAAAKKQAERQQQIEGAYRGAFVSPDVGGEGPPEEPRFSQDALIRNLMPFDPMTAATMSQPKPRKLTTVAPGASVIDEANPSKPLFTAPDKASAPAPTQLAKLIQERDMLPQGHPNRALYDQEIRKMTTHAPGVSVSYGTPVAVLLPDGTIGYAQPGNKPGAAPQMMTGPDGKPMQKPPEAPKALTEAQAKAAVFVAQMTSAEQELAGTPIDQTKLWSQVETGLAAGKTNVAAGQAAQRARQAQEQWAEAALRFKTGAATTADEINRNIRTFFPQPFDKPEVVAQKARARESLTRDIAIAAGSAAKPTTKAKKTVTRTGKANGRRVVEYSDGSVEYAD